MRPSSIFGRAFLDGISMGGLFTRLPQPGSVTWEDFAAAAESDAPIDAIRAIEQASRRSHRIASAGLCCGFLTSLVCLGLYVYLVMHAHPVIAFMMLGIWIVAPVVEIITALLRRRHH